MCCWHTFCTKERYSLRYKALRLVGFLFAIIFLGLPLECTAQDDYQNGYVVTNAGDTIYGLVRDRKTGAFGKLYKKIKSNRNSTLL